MKNWRPEYLCYYRRKPEFLEKAFSVLKSVTRSNLLIHNCFFLLILFLFDCNCSLHTAWRQERGHSIWRQRSREMYSWFYKVTIYSYNRQILYTRLKTNFCLLLAVTEIFSFKSSNYSLRNRRDFNIPTVNTVKYGKHSLRYFGPMLWSKLHSSLRNSPSLTSFKKSIRNIDLHELIENNCKFVTAVIFAGNDFLLIYIYLYK
jgi:hypothetical protein